MPAILRDRFFWFVVLAQAGLCLVAFNKIILHPDQNVLYADYDGGKNYFTPYSYVSDLGVPATGAHPLKVYGQHYPFGEYVFYTDNTPAVAIPSRVLAKAGINLPGEGVGALSMAIIFFQWLAAIMLFLLLRIFMRNPWLATFFSLALVWGCKQYWHQTYGSPNLGLTALTLAFILLLWRLWDDPKSWTRWLSVSLIIGFASWFHLYYLIVFGTSLALFSIVLMVKNFRGFNREDLQPIFDLALKAAAAGALGVALIYLPVLLIDDKLALRTGKLLGYGYEGWRVDIRSLITPPPELKTPFILSQHQRYFGEPSAYLGLWFWYAVLLGIVIGFWRSVKSGIDALRFSESGKFLLGLAIVGTFCFFASLGKEYSLPGGSWKWQVVLNPFYPFISSSVTLQQFRAIARFFFITQWAWVLPALFLIDLLWLKSKHWGRSGQWVKFGILVICVMAILDTKDVINARNKMAPLNPTGQAERQPFEDALSAAGVELSTYQALLYAPYYHVGSQAKGLIADPSAYYVQRLGFTLAAATRLPMLNAITSRTPPHEAKQLMEFVHTGVMGDSLASGLSNRPILVAVHRNAAASILAQDGQFYTPNEGLAREVVISSANFPEHQGVTKLASEGPIDFYRWDIGVED